MRNNCVYVIPPGTGTANANQAGGQIILTFSDLGQNPDTVRITIPPQLAQDLIDELQHALAPPAPPAPPGPPPNPYIPRGFQPPRPQKLQDTSGDEE